jgi:hypothetical protein
MSQRTILADRGLEPLGEDFQCLFGGRRVEGREPIVIGEADGSEQHFTRVAVEILCHLDQQEFTGRKRGQRMALDPAVVESGDLGGELGDP